MTSRTRGHGQGRGGWGGIEWTYVTTAHGPLARARQLRERRGNVREHVDIGEQLRMIKKSVFY